MEMVSVCDRGGGMPADWDCDCDHSFVGGIRETHEETDSYQITKMFIENKEQVLHNLLND